MDESDFAPGYVLHARAYRETSLLLDLWTLGGGRTGAIARGVRGARGSARRAILQPLQPLNIALRRRGELAMVTAVEPASRALLPRGERLLAALYVNELCQRLLPRDEPMDVLFADYAACLGRLESVGEIASVLRRFEWDLLTALGSAPDLSRDLRGEAVHRELNYRLRGDEGLEAVAEGVAGALRGSNLLELQRGGLMLEGDVAALRRMCRSLLLPLLGPRPLRCWGLLDELARSAGSAESPPPSTKETTD